MVVPLGWMLMKSRSKGVREKQKLRTNKIIFYRKILNLTFGQIANLTKMDKSNVRRTYIKGVKNGN